MSVRHAKIVRDVTINKSRTLLIVIAVAVGVMAFGLMQTGAIVLRANLRDSFTASRPAHSVMILSPFDNVLVEEIRGLSYVESVQARTITQALLETKPNKWVSLDLHTIPDFNAWDINKITVEDDALYPPPSDSILLERSLRLVADIGDTVNIKTLDGKIYNLRVAGFANDLSIVPTSIGLVSYGYITPETANSMDISNDYNRLYVRVNNATDRASIEKNITSVVKDIESKNIVVYSAPVPQLGKQLLEDSVASVLLILRSLGILTLLLSAFLVTAVMFAVMNQQVKQIGILKSLGAHASQTMALYFQQVILYGLLALLLAIPLSSIGGYFVASGVGDGMNMIINKFFIPPPTIILQILSALLIPLLAALIPIINGSRVTIREAISDYNPNNSSNMGLIGRILSIFGDLPQLVNLSVRNVFRRPGRLALNFATLVLAGAMFISVIGIRQSLHETVDEIQRDIIYDVDVDFSTPYSKVDIENLAENIDGVVNIESWSMGDGRIVISDEHLSGSIALISIPDDSQLTLPKAVDGRFLLPSDEYSIFVNADTLDLNPNLKPGSKIRLRIGTEEHEWTIVGIGTRGFGPLAYVYYDDLVSQTGADGFVNRLVVQGNTNSVAAQNILQTDLLTALDDAGYEVSASHTTTELKESTAAQMDTLVILLLAMVILIAVVGGLGLAITMSLNVMERTREIGIMRSLGAQNGVIRKLVIVEGLVIGIMSWAIAIPFSIPLAINLGNSLGDSLLATPLDYIFSVPAVLLWLALVIIISIISSLVPAQNASKLTIRDTLVYE